MNAKKVSKTVPVTTYKTEETISIEGITIEDAKALVEISRAVGGDPAGPRGAADRLGDALLQALGIPAWDASRRTKGSVYFK